MIKSLISGFFVSMLFFSCSKTPPSIFVVCEENSVGNAILKWETSPVMHGNVKVYASTDPEFIREVNPVAVAPISEGRLTIITDNPTKRYYYRLVFDNKYRLNTATRNINISGIQNFRDLGGYRSMTDKKNVAWGKLYRSGEIDTLTASAKREFKNMGIKTIVDLRGTSEQHTTRSVTDAINVVSIPIPLEELTQVLQGIQHGVIIGDTVNNIMERLNRELVGQWYPSYSQLFKLMLDKDNYPMVISCSWGKGRAGVASALVLYALGVSDDVVMNDYLLTNTYFNIPRASSYGYKLPVKSQEGITAVFMAKENFLNAAKSEIRRNYGDVPTYLQEGLGLSKEDQKKLQSILLE